MQCAASPHLRDEVLVLGGLHVLAKVHAAEVERGLVLLEDLLASREGAVVAAGGGGHLPGEQPGGHAHDGVEVARRELLRGGRERQHRRVLGTDVVGEGEALHHVGGGVLRVVLGLAAGILRKEQRVAARDVARASDVTHDLQHGDKGRGQTTVAFPGE